MSTDATHQWPPPSYEAAPTSLSSRPTLGFPLGTALLLLVIFCLSGVLSCCYHWDKIQALRRRALDHGQGQPADEENGAGAGGGVPPAGMPPPPSKPSVTDQYAKKETSESLPVIMPGDRIPKFVARPCPCDHLDARPPRASDEPPPPDQPEKLAATDHVGPGLSSPASLPAPAAVPPPAALLYCSGPALQEPTQL